MKAGVAWEQAWQLVTQEDGWKRETKEPKVKDGGVKDISNGVPTPVVYSRQVTDLGKVFRVEVRSRGLQGRGERTRSSG